MPVSQTSRNLLLSLLPLSALALVLGKGNVQREGQASTSLSATSRDFQSLAARHSPNGDTTARFSTRRFTLALNSAGYTAAGAGTAADNANYPIIGNDANGNPFLRNSTSGKGIAYGPGLSGYFLGTLTAAGAQSGSADYIAPSSAVGTLPLTGWTNSGGVGVNPAPTFTAISSAPAVPTGVTATASAGLGMTINAGNTASQPSGTTYSLLRGTTAGGENATPIATGFTLPYTFAEPAAGTFFYQLTATSGGATSAASAEVSATAYNSSSQGSNTATATPSVPAPGAATSLTAVFQETASTLALLLGWTLPTGGQAQTGINGRYANTLAGLNSGGGTSVAAASASATSVLLPSLAHNNDYYVVVDLIDAGGTTTSAVIHVKSDTLAVTNLAATAGNNVNNLTWTPSAGAIASQVFAGPHGGALALLTTVGAGVGTYADTTAVNGTAKDYQIFELN